MERKAFYITLICFLFLVLLIFAGFKIVTTKKIEVVEVLVAKETIYPRTKISAENTTIVEIPKTCLSDNVLLKKEEVIGRYTQIYATIVKGSMFYSELLEEGENMSDYPSLLLNEKQVSYSLTSDIIKSSGNSLVAGQKVDIYVTISQKDKLPATDCLIKAVRIIAIKDRGGKDIKEEKSSKVPYVIIVAVNDDLVKYLKAAGKLGTIDIYPVNANYQDKEESIFQADSTIVPYLTSNE